MIVGHDPLDVEPNRCELDEGPVEAHAARVALSPRSPFPAPCPLGAFCKSLPDQGLRVTIPDGARTRAATLSGEADQAVHALRSPRRLTGAPDWGSVLAHMNQPSYAALI